jgi:hypothetical protein
VKIALGPASSYTAARPMPEPGRGAMNFRADAGIYVRVTARNREMMLRASQPRRCAESGHARHIEGVLWKRAPKRIQDALIAFTQRIVRRVAQAAAHDSCARSRRLLRLRRYVIDNDVDEAVVAYEIRYFSERIATARHWIPRAGNSRHYLYFLTC